MVPDVLVRCVPHSPNMRYETQKTHSEKNVSVGYLITEMWLCWQMLTTLHSNLYLKQAQVVQKLDSALPWINHYPEDKTLVLRETIIIALSAEQ